MKQKVNFRLNVEKDDEIREFTSNVLRLLAAQNREVGSRRGRVPILDECRKTVRLHRAAGGAGDLMVYEEHKVKTRKVS